MDNGSNPAQIDYMNALWKSINQFSETMMDANKKYKKAISRKRNSPQPSFNINTNTSTQPPIKKPKISPSTSKIKPFNKTPTKTKTKSSGSNDERIYKIKRPRTSWILFNSYKTAELVNEHPKTTLGERTQMSAKEWHSLNKLERKKWDDKANEEKKKYQRIVDMFHKYNDFDKVPAKWKKIDKKAEKERKEKMDIDEKDNKSVKIKGKKSDSDSNYSDSDDDINTVKYKVSKNSMTFYPTPNIKRGTKKFKTVPFYSSNNCPSDIESCFDNNKPIVNEFDEICSFIKCAELAYAKHYPLLIKPEHIFILIVQAISVHVDKNAEKLRYKFVNHENKMELRVVAGFKKGSPNNDWGSLIHKFVEQIDGNTKKDVVPLFDSNFSTSTLNEKIAAKITLMSTCKNYFKYKMIKTICGFPEITLDGTINDWILLKTKVQTLLSQKVAKRFGNKWSKSLIPILDRFIGAFKGDISMVFWNSMIYRGQWSYWESSGAYGRGGKVKAYKKFISGWINTFFPFIGGRNYENKWAFKPYSGDATANKQYKGKHGKELTSLLGPEPKEFPKGTASAPVLWKYSPFTTYKMDFVAGFMGYEQDKTSLQLRPVIGWYIKENDEKDSKIKQSVFENLLHGD